MVILLNSGKKALIVEKRLDVGLKHRRICLFSLFLEKSLVSVVGFFHIFLELGDLLLNGSSISAQVVNPFCTPIPFSCLFSSNAWQGMRNDLEVGGWSFLPAGAGGAQRVKDAVLLARDGGDISKMPPWCWR